MAVAAEVYPAAHLPGMGSPPATDAGLATFTLLKRWADWMEVSGRYSAKTRHAYRRYVISFLADTLIPLSELTEDDVVGYLATLPATGDMRGAVLRALRCLFRYAGDRGMADPVRRLKVPRKKYGAAPFIETDDLDRIFSAAETLDPRARPTLELMFSTGARLGSIVAVLPSDVDLGRRTIHFRIAKGDRPYSVPLGERGYGAVLALLALQDYRPKMASHRRATLVGVGHGTVQRWVSEAGAMVGIHASPHLLRHSFAERICNDPSVPALVAAELLNHQNTDLLRRYASGRGELQRAAVASL